MVDPGIGFAKTHDQSYALLMGANLLKESLQVPVMIGHSRKRFLKHAFLDLNDTHPWPSEAVREDVNRQATALAVKHGADMVRVHV
jgi:dihydropteroate synthase